MSPDPTKSARTKIVIVAATLMAVVVFGGSLGYYFWPGGFPAGEYRFASTVAGLNREFGEPFGIAVRGGEIYVSDGDAGKVWLIRNGTPTFFAEGLHTPSALAFDKAGNLIVADSGSHTIRSVSVTGDVTVVAGVPGKAGFADGEAVSALFDAPVGLAIDTDGRIFVADTYNDRIRVIEKGRVTTAAGSITGFAEGTAAEAEFRTPTAVAVWNEKLLVADTGNRRIRVVEAGGRVWTLAGNGSPDAKDGTLLSASFVQPTGIAVSENGMIYVTDGNAIRRVGGEPFPVVTTVSSRQRGLTDGRAAAAKFDRPSGMAFSSAGDLLIADSDNRLVRALASHSGGHHISAAEAAHLRETAEEFRNLQPPRWPYDPPEAKRDVAGTLGELRGIIPETKDPPRFHNGLDIAGDYGETARFVRSEAVLRPNAVDGFGTLRESVRMPTMGYIHIRIGRSVTGLPFDDPRFQFERDAAGKLTGVRIPRGSVFKAGEPIGTLNQMNHVHLIAGRSGFEINALDALVLPNFTDTRPPTVENVTLFKEDWQPLETAAPNSRIRLTGKVRIVVRAYDQVDGNAERRRLGVYRVGYQVLNADLSPAADVKWNILFDRMPATGAVKFAYAPGSRSGATGETIFNYIASNMVEGDDYGEGFLDTAELAAGRYVLRGMVSDQAGNISHRDIEFEVAK
jgi:sugar lactone lactonase YvrE